MDKNNIMPEAADERRRRKLRATVGYPSTAHLTMQDDALVERVRLFDVASSTPEECVKFVRDLQEEVSL